VRTHEMYLAPLDDCNFAYFVTRMWWMPWRYSVWAQPTREPAHIVATNFTRDQAKGLLKFFGAYNIGE
jgi:hypothetical protein